MIYLSAQTYLPLLVEQDFLARRRPMSVRAFVTAGKFIDIGVPEDYQRAQSLLAEMARPSKDLPRLSFC